MRAIFVLYREVLSNVIGHEYRLLQGELKSVGELLRTSAIIVMILLIVQWAIRGNTY